MASNYKEWYVQLINERLDKPVSDSTGVFQVYNSGAATRPVIRDASGTVLTQEVKNGDFVSRTMSNGIIRFFTNATQTAVDLSVLTAGGRAYFLKGLVPSNHRVDVDPERSDYTLIGVISDNASSTALRSTGFSARQGMIIQDVFVRVTVGFKGAATGNNTFNFGVAGNSGGFSKLQNLTATGYKSILVHSSTGKIFATQFAGTLLANWDTASAQTVLGWFTRKPYFAGAATVLAYARIVALTASFTGTKASTGKAYVFYRYSLDPTITNNI